MIVFKFSDADFKKASDLMKSAIDSFGTGHFDHSYQPDDKTITVSEKNAHIVEGWFKKNKIKFKLNRGYGKYSKQKIAVASQIRRSIIASLLSHAKRELELAGLFDKDSDCNGMMGKALMKLVKCFSDQGHSGFSASMVLNLFDLLGNYKSLSPITDDPKDWIDVSETSGARLWQCKRDPSLFSEDGGKIYYDVDDKKRKKLKSEKRKGNIVGKTLKVKKDKILKSTPFLDLVATPYEDLKGLSKEWAWVKRPLDREAVVICATYEDKLIIIKEYRVPLKDYEYGFPAGLVDKNETPEEAATRELKEETGLDIDKIYSVSPSIYSSSGLTNESIYIVICSCKGDMSKKWNEGSEDISTYLMSRKKVKDLLKKKNIKFGAKAWLMMSTFANEEEY